MQQSQYLNQIVNVKINIAIAVILLSLCVHISSTCILIRKDPDTIQCK